MKLVINTSEKTQSRALMKMSYATVPWAVPSTLVLKMRKNSCSTNKWMLIYGLIILLKGGSISQLFCAKATLLVWIHLRLMSNSASASMKIKLRATQVSI